MSPAPSPPLESGETAGGIQVTLQTDRTITFKDLAKAASSQDAPLSLSLSHLTDCIVDLRGDRPHIVALTATNLKRCAVLLPRIDGSLMLTRLEDSLLVVEACRQLRVYSSKRAVLDVAAGGVASPITLESCEAMRVTSGIKVQDFDQPGAGPSAEPTKSWRGIQAREAQHLEALKETPSAEALADILSQLFSPAAAPATSSSPYLAADSGLLLVFSSPGTQATQSEFHEWYDEEHVPLRVGARGFPEFRSAARYSCSTLTSPSATASPAFQAEWGAAYTISSNALYNDARYTALRSNRSPREADLVKRLGVLDRRIYKTMGDSRASKEPRGDVRPQRKEQIEEEACRVEVTGFDAEQSEAEVAKWFADEAKPALLKREGVTRVRLLVLIDALINGVEAGEGNADAKDVPRWALYIEGAEGVEGVTTQVVKLPGAVNRTEVRTMKLYRAWDPIGALQEGCAN